MMKSFLKTCYYAGLDAVCADRFLLRHLKSTSKAVILNLHQVSPHKNPFWPPLNPKIFDELLGFLKANFEIVLFDELDNAENEKPLAVLSFDDGYHNFVEYALPLLDKHGIRANVNIIPACVESGESTWNIQLYDFLNSAPKNLINEISFPGFDVKLNNESFGSKLRYGLSISYFLKKRSRNERQEMWQSLEKIMLRHEFPRTRMINRQEVIQIAKRHEIGVHSYSHESMEFEEDSFFEDDLQKCITYFREHLRLPLVTYAFPYGNFNSKQVAILRKYGFRNILVVGEDYCKPDELVFSRFTICGASTIEAKFQALGINRLI